MKIHGFFFFKPQFPYKIRLQSLSVKVLFQKLGISNQGDFFEALYDSLTAFRMK